MCRGAGEGGLMHMYVYVSAPIFPLCFASFQEDQKVYLYLRETYGVMWNRHILLQDSRREKLATDLAEPAGWDFGPIPPVSVPDGRDCPKDQGCLDLSESTRTSLLV